MDIDPPTLYSTKFFFEKIHKETIFLAQALWSRAKTESGRKVLAILYYAKPPPKAKPLCFTY